MDGLEISDMYVYASKSVSSRIIWLGDLNYRIALSYDDAKRLVETKDWTALFDKDQVIITIFIRYNLTVILYFPLRYIYHL